MFSAFLLVLALALASPACSFAPTGALSCLHSTSTTVWFQQESTNWDEYKHDYVDPLVPHSIQSKLHDHIDPTKRKASDEYWLRQMEQDKEKLHNMMNEDQDKTSDTDGIRQEQHYETFQHYKQANIDPITRHRHPVW